MGHLRASDTSRCQAPLLGSSRLVKIAHIARPQIRFRRQSSSYRAAVGALEIVERQVAAAWVRFDDALHQRLAAPRADFTARQDKRHDGLPGARCDEVRAAEGGGVRYASPTAALEPSLTRNWRLT